MRTQNVKIPKVLYMALKAACPQHGATVPRLLALAAEQWLERNGTPSGSSAKIVPDRVTMPTRSEPTVEYDEFNQEPRHW